MQKRRSFSKEEEKIIIETYKKFLNLGKCGRELGLWPTTISRVLKRNGVNVIENKSGENHPGWKGGKIFNKGDGYVGIWMPGHERADGGNYVYEHTLNYQKATGKLPGKKEVLHHIDLDKHNNDISNLFLCDNKKHLQIHRDIEKLIKPLMKLGIVVFKDGEYSIACDLPILK